MILCSAESHETSIMFSTSSFLAPTAINIICALDGTTFRYLPKQMIGTLSDNSFLTVRPTDVLSTFVETLLSVNFSVHCTQLRYVQLFNKALLLVILLLLFFSVLSADAAKLYARFLQPKHFSIVLQEARCEMQKHHGNAARRSGRFRTTLTGL